MDPTTAPDHPDAKAEFVERFRTGWATGNLDEFMEYLLPRVTADTRLRQPLSRQAFGPDGLRRMFTGVFAAVPDLHAIVHRWGPTDDGVLIEFTLTGILGKRPISIDVVDRFVLREGAVVSVDTYFDPLPLLPRLLRNPLLSLRLLPRFFPSAAERTALRAHTAGGHP